MKTITVTITIALCDSLKPSQMIDFSAIVSDFSNRTGIAVEDILGSSRKMEVVAARHLLWHLLSDKTGASYTRIGKHFGRKHPAVIHGVKSVRSKLEIDDKIVGALWELVEDMEV